MLIEKRASKVTVMIIVIVRTRCLLNRHLDAKLLFGRNGTTVKIENLIIL